MIFLCNLHVLLYVILLKCVWHQVAYVYHIEIFGTEKPMQTFVDFRSTE